MIARRTLAATAAAVLAVGVAAVAAPAVHAADKPVVVNCTGKGVSKPAEIIIACADDGISITKISWSSWTADRAKGTGSLDWNPCLPNCVSSQTLRYPVKITLGGLASAPGKPDVFSQATLTFPKGGPANLATGSYVLDNNFS